MGRRRFAKRLSFATGFGPEGCVILDLIARHELDVDVFTLDTGLLFPETYALWRRLEERYGLTIRAVRPALDRRGAGRSARRARSGSASPTAAARSARSSRCAGRSRAASAWISAIRRDQTAGPRGGARRRARPPLRRSSRSTRSRAGRTRDVWALPARARRAREPAARAGLPQHRLPALHEPGRCRRGPARGPLARAGRRPSAACTRRPQSRLSAAPRAARKEPRAMSLSLAETALVPPTRRRARGPLRLRPEADALRRQRGERCPRSRSTRASSPTWS